MLASSRRVCLSFFLLPTHLVGFATISNAWKVCTKTACVLMPMRLEVGGGGRLKPTGEEEIPEANSSQMCSQKFKLIFL